METRENQLKELNTFVKNVDKDLTMILQSLQWDRKSLFEAKSFGSCKYTANHKMPSEGLEQHEKKCLLKSHGYTDDMELLPDPPDCHHSQSLVKLNADDINKIIENASKTDSTFKRGPGSRSPQPLTLGRLQVAYTSDERRAIYDAVVNAAPSCHDLTDLALTGMNGEEQQTRAKSRMEVLAELRDMKRRRTKYRVAAKSSKYSDVLRDVIKSQMEMYADVKTEHVKQERLETNERNDTSITDRDNKTYNRHKSYEHEEYKAKIEKRQEDKTHKVREEDKYTKRNKYDDRRESEKREPYNRSNDRKIYENIYNRNGNKTEERDNEHSRRDRRDYSSRSHSSSSKDYRDKDYRHDRKRGNDDMSDFGEGSHEKHRRYYEYSDKNYKRKSSAIDKKRHGEDRDSYRKSKMHY